MDDLRPLATLTRPRVQRLLVYLLLQRHSSLTREAVAFSLWPDSREQEALGQLRRALNELRAALPPIEHNDWIITTQGELGWNPKAPYSLDIEQFERLNRQATPPAWREAVALYTGDLLLELGDEWVVSEREHLRLKQLETLGRLATHHRGLGDYDAAISFVRRKLALDPLLEGAYRELMTLQYLAGDRAAALASFERLRAALREELSVEPMAETQALVSQIMQGSLSPPMLATPVYASPAVLLTQARPRLIGREAEMTELAALWNNAKTGQGRFIILSGESGVGKSHLALSLAEYAAQQGGLTLVGHCYEFERALPYQGILELLRSATHLIRYADLAPAHRAALARIVPDVLGTDHPLLSDEALEGDFRNQLFEALLQVFIVLARTQPLFLLVEDIQWASESTRDWLTYIVSRLATTRLLVTITYRTEEVEDDSTLARLGRRFGREGSVTTLALRPLSREAIHEWVIHLSGLEVEHVRPIAERLFADTAGNPFYLQEMVRALTESGQVVTSGGRWSGPFIQTASRAHTLLPESLRDTINARVKRLEEASQMFLRGGAVAGGMFDYEIVKHAIGWEDDVALDALEDLLARGFIRPVAADGTYAFSHHLVQEAIYAHLPTPRKVYWHRRIAEATQNLRRTDEASVSDLAHHFYRSGSWEQALGYLLRAGDAAAQVHAQAEARLYYSEALEALAHLPKTDDYHRQHVDAVIKYVSVSYVADEPELNLARLAEAEALTQNLTSTTRALGNDRLRLARVHYWMGRIYFYRGRQREAIRYFQQMLAVAHEFGDKQLLTIPTSVISRVLITQGQFGQARPLFEQALEPLERAGNWDEWCVNSAYLGLSLAAQGKYAVGLATGQQALTRILELKNSTRTAAVQIILSLTYFMGGDFQPMWELSRAGLEAADQSGDRLYVYFAHGFRAWAESRLGNPAAALVSMASTRSIGQSLGGRLLISDWFAAAEAEMTLAAGRPQMALTLAEEAVTFAKTLEGVFAEGLAERVWGQALAALQHPHWPEIEAHLAASLHAFEMGAAHLEVARTHVIWGAICRGHGDESGARLHLERAAVQFEESGLALELEKIHQWLRALPPP